jgi:hypothetical protein
LKIFRKLASTTDKKLYKVAWYKFFSVIRSLPPREDVEKAATLLVALPKAQFATVEEKASLRPFDTMEQIRTLLRPKTAIEQPKCEQQPA